jgi:hypothetical protein
MHPFLRDGDAVTVRPLAGRLPRPGDIVAFIHPGTGRPAVHRVVGRVEGGFLLRGDNADAADGAVPAPGIIGIVDRVERSGRRTVAGAGRLRGAVALASRLGCLRRATRLLSRLRRALRPRGGGGS